MAKMRVRPRRGKFNAVRTTVDGITFASKAEARRYQELRLLEKAGQISSLMLQPKYQIVINGVNVCTYIADFSYVEPTGERTWARRLEDVKGVKTPVYNLKKKLMKAIHNIDILETR
jgi:hypothetical protein